MQIPGLFSPKPLYVDKDLTESTSVLKSELLLPSNPLIVFCDFFLLHATVPDLSSLWQP